MPVDVALRHGRGEMDVEAKQVGRQTVDLRRDRGDARSRIFGGRDREGDVGQGCGRASDRPCDKKAVLID
jgi:hypothetical protein